MGKTQSARSGAAKRPTAGAAVPTPLFTDPTSAPEARELIEHLALPARKELVVLVLEGLGTER